MFPIEEGDPDSTAKRRNNPVRLDPRLGRKRKNRVFRSL